MHKSKFVIQQVHLIALRCTQYCPQSDMMLYTPEVTGELVP